MRPKFLMAPLSLVLFAGSAQAALLGDARGDFLIAPANGTTALFNGGTGLSSSDGSGRWNYFGGANLLTFGPAGNAGQSMYATTGQTDNLPALGDKAIFNNVIGPAPDEIQMHAGGNGLPATMTWTAGASVNNLAIRGDIQHGIAVGSAKFDILVNGVNAFTTTLTSTVPAAFSLTGLNIAAGQNVEFILSNNGNGTGGDIADLRAAIFDTTAGVPGLLFSETFNGYSGTFNGGQFETSLAVGHTGSLPGWSKTGAGTVHAVDHANVNPNIVAPRDFAVMIFGGGNVAQQNIITLSSAIAGSNVLGTEYELSFDASPAVYQAGSQATNSTDGLLVELLRALDNTVLHSFTHLPGAWPGGAGSFDLDLVTFNYTGDGTGDLIIRIGPGGTAGSSNRFGGAIDNVTLTALAAVIPEPSTCVLAIVGFAFLQRRRSVASDRALV